MQNFSIFALLPEDALNHQAIIRVIGDNPECTEGLLIEALNTGNPTETLGRIKGLCNNLIGRGYLTIDDLRQKHALTDKGKKVYSLLHKKDELGH